MTAIWDEPNAPYFYLKMRPFLNELDFIVAVRGSCLTPFDETTLSQKFGIRSILKLEEAGQSAAYRAALSVAMESGYEGVILIDSNGKDDPKYLPAFVKALEEGKDLVQGCRFKSTGKHVNTPVLRIIAVRLIAPFILWLGCGYWYRDQCNGLKGLSRKFLLDPRVQPFRDIFKKYNLLVYLNYAVVKHQFKWIEIPASRVYPKGKIPTKLTSFRQYLLHLLDYFKTAMGLLNPMIETETSGI